MNERTKRLSRRKFLMAAGSGGVVAAAATLAAKNSQPSTPATGTDKRATRGYQSSEHTDNYYRTTKV